LQGENKCSSPVLGNMIRRLLLHGEKGKVQNGLVNLEDVVQKFPALGSNKPLPKVTVAVAIMLVSTLVSQVDG